jgi:uncharacterized protein YjbJ (UPF0337 family)
VASELVSQHADAQHPGEHLAVWRKYVVGSVWPGARRVAQDRTPQRQRRRRIGTGSIATRARIGDKRSGVDEGLKGTVEDIKGKAKETVGPMTGRDDLTQEGKAQQDNADAQQDAAKEAEPESARGGAKAAEQRQEASQ